MIPNMRAGKDQSLKPFIDSLPDRPLGLLEIGCFAGDGTIQFLQSDKIQSMTCVDLYKGGYDPDDTASACNMNDVMMKFAEQIALLRIRKPLTVHYFQHSSQIPIRKYDVVYIDANHQYENVSFDIQYTLMYLQPDIIAGHDYGVGKHPGVERAVLECFPEATIELFPDSTWKVVL